jgi:hypothetical protein
MIDLEHRLVDLGRHLAVPAGDDLAQAVTARLVAPPGEVRRRWRRWWRWLAGVVFVGAGVAAAPAVADWLGVDGVVVHQESAPTSPTVPLDRGQPVALEDVPDRAGFTPLVPEALGAPDEVHVDDRPAVPVVWLRWDDGPLLTELAGAAPDEPVIEKYAPGVTIEEVRVGRRRGLWVAGPHEVVLEAGEPSAVPGRRTAGGTLLLEVGPVTVRIETTEGRDEAIRIASSLPGT